MNKYPKKQIYKVFFEWKKEIKKEIFDIDELKEMKEYIQRLKNKNIKILKITYSLSIDLTEDYIESEENE